MADQFSVEPDQLRRHAATLDAIRDRFAAVQGASAAIAQDDAAYGILCGWIAGILETRHTSQNQLIADVQENLSRAAQAVRAAGSGYEEIDDDNSRLIRAAGKLS